MDLASGSIPFLQLSTAVNELHRGARLLGDFDWTGELQSALSAYPLDRVTCFGIGSDFLPLGSESRPDLADATEVYAVASNAVAYADRYQELTIDPSPGLANLQQLAAKRAFFGCYTSSPSYRWMGHSLAFFVDPASGFRVLVETWAE